MWSRSYAILSSVACHAHCTALCLPQSGQFDLQDKSWIQNSSRLHCIDIKSWIGCNEKDSACGLKSIDLWTRGGHFIAVQQSKRIARIATFWHLPTNQPTKCSRNFNNCYNYFNSQTLVQNINNFTTIQLRTPSSILSRKYFAKETVFFYIFCHKDLLSQLKPRRGSFSCFESLNLFPIVVL